MGNERTLTVALVLLFTAGVTLGGGSAGSTFDKWVDLGTVVAADTGESAVEATAPATTKPAPIPIHTIEGYGGGIITPMAYLINPGPEGTTIGLPTVSVSFIKLNDKDLEVVAISQTFFRRFELSYAMNRLGIGSLDNDIDKRLGIDLNRKDIYLHHFNLRGLLIEENSFGLPLPAVVAGVHFKYNDSIQTINRRLGGAFRAIGLEKSNGVDWTLTATKMFPELACGRPIILTGGLRLSQAAQLGLLGFDDECSASFEGSVAYLPLDNLMLAYEIRQKDSPYDEVDELIGEEDTWHAISATWIVNEHLTLTAAWLGAGNIANSRADCSWGFQARWEF